MSVFYKKHCSGARMACEQGEVSRHYFASAKITPQNLTLLYSQLLVKVRFRTRIYSSTKADITYITNRNKMSMDFVKNVVLYAFSGVLGLLVGFGNWRQTTRNAFTIGF